ncbi:hypothetical protein, partial [Legionella sp. PL877]|uniref:hypothetical protein n=1 Tax=Legionella sp. PL877 TaxID=3046773 RepID=UPI0024B84D85
LAKLGRANEHKKSTPNEEPYLMLTLKEVIYSSYPQIDSLITNNNLRLMIKCLLQYFYVE